MYFVNDNSGINKLTVNKIYLSAAYYLVGPESSLHFGFQAGYVMNSFAKDKLHFPDQFNTQTGLFDTSLPNNENVDENVNYFDMNVGCFSEKEIFIF